MEQEFINACINERSNFINDINKQEWNTQMRTSSESLIIMYDQMIEKLKTKTVVAVNPLFNTMARRILKLKIDVKKLNKEYFFVGEKGTYANVTVLLSEEEDNYGNNGMIVQDVPKAIYEKDKTVKGAILGNAKFFGNQADSSNEGKVGEESGTPFVPLPNQADDDLPF